jgi:hypothetical protein
MEVVVSAGQGAGGAPDRRLLCGVLALAQDRESTFTP